MDTVFLLIIIYRDRAESRQIHQATSQTLVRAFKFSLKITGHGDYNGQFGQLEGYLILFLMYLQTIKKKQFCPAYVTFHLPLKSPNKHVLI